MKLVRTRLACRHARGVRPETVSAVERHCHLFRAITINPINAIAQINWDGRTILMAPSRLRASTKPLPRSRRLR